MRVFFKYEIKTKPTMLSDSRLLFDDEFDDTTNEIAGEGEFDLQSYLRVMQPVPIFLFDSNSFFWSPTLAGHSNKSEILSEISY